MFLSLSSLEKQQDDSLIVVFSLDLFEQQGTQHCSTDWIAGTVDLKANMEEPTVLLSKLYNTALLL